MTAKLLQAEIGFVLLTLLDGVLYFHFERPSTFAALNVLSGVM
jgi:hypothetical protein